ncbi:hypothetical protein [Derxia gummosa]|uniref:VCBS repeat-containing protein n=1 Tax=Derxia gummosa DSM 723 TaxID=1121388 RepID=A0A8B6XB21_9BURK|nr:hypothetical protein [Derxia gummosa]
MPAVLLPGSYPADQAPARPGDGWFALNAPDEGWQLVRVKLRPARIDKGPGEPPGVRIPDRPAGVLVFVRQAGLTAGKVRTPALDFRAGTLAFEAAAPLRLPFDGRDYRIDVADGRPRLRLDDRVTPLDGLSVGESAPGSDYLSSASLLWAGDLDRDGRLDLLVAHDSLNRNGVCLFLSSRAAPGQLVGRAGCHDLAGC